MLATSEARIPLYVVFTGARSLLSLIASLLADPHPSRVAGTAPYSELCSRAKPRRALRLPREAGMPPLIWLLLRRRAVRAVRSPKDCERAGGMFVILEPR